MVQFPAGWHDPNQLSAAPQPRDAPAAPEAPDTGESAVYEWWFGGRPHESDLKGEKPWGFWKWYHPKVCMRLGEACRGDEAFR